jgi:DNA mismatch endonuclease (patch repair protein)
MPATRKEFWQSKFKKTILRDKHNLKKLHLLGWKILILWECQTRKPETLAKRIAKFLKQ